MEKNNKKNNKIMKKKTIKKFDPRINRRAFKIARTP